MTPRPRRKSDPVRAIAYVRVSSDQQAESGLSLEHQQAKCRALATVNDYQLVDVIIDAGESAANLNRPGMARVLEMVEARQVEAVLIAKLDRLTRSVSDLSDLLRRFTRRHVALVSASESLNTETAAGRMVVKMLGVVAEWEREAIGERTRDALRTLRLKGMRCGEVPYGWTQPPKPPGAHQNDPAPPLVPNYAEREMITYARELRAAGRTWKATAETLNAERYRTRGGRPWTLHNLRAAVLTAERHEAERQTAA